MPPIGAWTVGTDELPYPDQKRSRAVWTTNDSRRGQVFAFGTKTAQRGVYSAPRGKCRLSAYERLVRTGFASGAKATRRFIRPAFTGSRCASVIAVVFTCNTYSVPYKGKDLKKRLSPKSPNTLIHSYVTFYIFLIFQYLSLWKSVFSPN